MKEYMKDVHIEDALKAGHTDTICWDCKNAMRGGCSWADPDCQQPVPGWAAVETDNGFVVHACPKFVRDTYGCGRYRTADDYILALEIGLTDRKRQIAKLKKTPQLLRKKNEKLVQRYENLASKYDADMWHASVHLSD